MTIVQWGETLVAEASLVSWNATTFTLNWTTNNNSATLIHYILIGGADVSAKVLNWQAPTSTGPKTVTGVGFRPDLVFHLNGTAGLTAAAPVSQPGAGYGFSLMNAAGEQGVIANIVNDAASATPLAARGQRIDAALGATAITGSNGEFVIQAGYSAMHSDGFTLNFSRVAGPMQVVSLALHRVHSKLGTFFAPMSGTPTQAVTGAGFQPELVLVTNWGISIFTAVLKDASHALGAADGTRQAVASLLNEDRSATNNLAAQSTSRVVYKLDAAGEVVNEAALSSLDSTVVVVAAGNSGTDLLTYPASFDNVIAVGATDYDGTRAFFSNYGPNVDVMAPGGSIWSSYPGGGYAYMSGTSMAAPHAAGVAALMLSVNSNPMAAQIKALLQTTATDMDAPGVDQYTGYGLINAQAAVAAVAPAVFVTPTTSLTATLAVDANANGLVDVGDTLRYLVTVANPGATPLANAVVSATVPLHTSYVISSTRLSGIPVRDDAAPKTALPLDAGGLNIGTVAARGSSVVSFDVVMGQLPRGVYTVVGRSSVVAGAGSQELQVVTPIAGTLLQAAVDKASAQIGQALTYSLTSDYLGSDRLSNVVVTAAVPVGTNYVAGSANAGGTLSSGTPSGGGFVPQPGTAGFDPGAPGSSGTITATTTPGDTYIDQLNPNNNYEANLRVHVLPDVSNNKQRVGLLKFDLSGVPARARIDSATLTARLQRMTTAWDANIYRLLTAWTETAATWNDTDGTGPGDWASGTFSASDYDVTQRYGPLDMGVAAPPAVDVTGLARSWLESGLPNYGIALIGSAQSTNRAELYDSEDAGLEPKLTLNWSIPAEPATRNVLAAAPTSVNTGGVIQVSLALTATQPITNVTASLSQTTLAGNAAAACVRTSASPQNINVGSTTTFTWDCTTSGAGELRFTGAAAGRRFEPSAGAAYSRGRVTLTWQTANESQLVGFRILRETADGASQLVNSELIPAQYAGANQGAVYAITDTPAPGAYTYVLEASRTDGRRVRAAETTLHVAAPAASPRLFLPLVVQTNP